MGELSSVDLQQCDYHGIENEKQWVNESEWEPWEQRPSQYTTGRVHYAWLQRRCHVCECHYQRRLGPRPAQIDEDDWECLC
eukprot:2335128-Amphidinium_carterae.1